jgi:regulation of enolase protein 1 (concanavalin A-like superfamily)
MGRVVLICSVLLVTGVAHAQDWTSNDVGAVALSGDAHNSAGSWTIRGSGADIWGSNDAFQFLHRESNGAGLISARVVNFQAAQMFAKAGVMIRGSLDANTATAILDVKPDGGIEFMARSAGGELMQFVDGAASPFPVWLRLGWTGDTVTASTSKDGRQWTVLCTTNVDLPLVPDAGVAVTSHDNTQLATATVDNLSIGVQRISWTPQPVGASSAGSATELNGVWTISGAGSDIWGAADSFEFLARSVRGNGLNIVARIDDVQNTHPFAKTGLMVRTGLDANTATALIDVTPGGHIEFMARTAASSEMTYLGGANATMPVWLQLSWSPGANATTVVGSMSTDGVTWTPVGPQTSLPLITAYVAGVAVTSHDVAQSTTAHVEGLCLLPSGWRSNTVGTVTTLGNAAFDTNGKNVVVTIEGAGTDIWGNADAFQIVQLPGPIADHSALTYRVVSLDNTNAFAKAGVIFRDSTNAGAPSVILDATPDGGVEFMARLCGQCATTFLSGGRIIFPAYLSLTRDGATFTASIFTSSPGDGSTLGSVTVPMSDPVAGFAVTSHDASRMSTAVFDNPAR